MGYPTYNNAIAGFGAPQVGAPTQGMFEGFNFGQDNGLGGSFLGQADAAGGIPGQEGWFGQIGGMKGLGQLAQGLASIGSIYSAFQGLKLAKDQFKFSKDAYRENMDNSKQAYNTSLEDRIRSRGHTEGQATSAIQSYLDKNRL